MEKYEDKAEIMKALGHPIRLCIVRGLLTEAGCNVNNMRDCLDIPQSTLSQHLAKLRNLNILKGKRNGVEMKYYVISEDAKRIIKTLFPEDKYQQKGENQ